jgi:type I restriction enzyme S subunit
MSEWRECKLGDVVVFNYGRSLPIKKRNNGNIPVYSSAGLIGWHDKALVDSKGLIIGRKGTIGKVYKSENPFFAIDTSYYILPDNDSYDFDFLFFLLGSIGLDELNEDSAVPGLNRNTAYSQLILFPSLSEQKAIASVLSSLDDKIDLLHQQNKTLEAMAETLFRQWFVEEAKDDWEDGCLGDLVELVYGKGLKKENRTGIGYPVVGSNGIVDYHSEFLVEAPGIVIGRKGTLGQTFYFEENFYPIDTTYYVKSRNKNKHLYFEYFLLKTINFSEMNTDSAVPGLNRNIALGTELLLPPENIITFFNDSINPIFKKIIKNKSHIHTLEKLRDTLLPKLMNGEVRVFSNV